MNHTEVIQTIAERSSIDVLTCEQIIKGYEKYCESNITRTSRKHMKTIIGHISNETLIDSLTCQVVMENFFDLMKAQIKSKIPFMK
ncbi:hypothetical protein [Enterococcus larvae]|uniref:hypothetical protein n=1 Tax=Enterococcus larvae TaxID=2794352 RepID=UPI003F3F3FF0